jgi:1-acyl-sn-glycerol-3-phosphate acyltransferase
MPRWVRTILSAFGFGMFFAATLGLGLFALPLLLFTRAGESERRRFTTRLNASLVLFGSFMRDTGLIDYWPPVLPARYEGRPFLLLANHPSLIDVVLILGSLPQLSCVAKASWYGSLLMGPMLRRTEFVPGPGHEGDEESDGEVRVVRRIEEKLRSGIPMLVFPEGSRSLATELRRFRRGAIEAAIRAEVPILPLYIDVCPAFLMKGVPFHRVPRITPTYGFEWLEPIETEGRDLSAREVAQDLMARYQARFAQSVADRAALEAAPA